MGGMRALTATESKTVDQLLAVLDRAADDGQFPFPQHERMDHAGMRVHGYRKADDHILLFEKLVFEHEEHRNMGFHGFCNIAFSYSAGGQQLAWDNDALDLQVERDPDGASVSLTEDSDEFIDTRAARQALNPEARALIVRGERVEVPRDVAAYRAHKIDPAEPIALRDVLRYLFETRRDALFSSEEERAEMLPGATRIFTLDAWRHPDAGDAPSDSESMRLLVEAVVTGDPARFAPKEPPNTDWRVIEEG